MSKSVTLSKYALHEVIAQVQGIALARATLTTIIILLSLMLLTTLVTIPWYWAAIGAIPFAIYTYIKNMRNANLYLVENTAPEFRHMLTTVADTVQRENEVIESLRAEMLEKLKHIKNSYFIEFGTLGAKVVSIIVLSILIISLTAFNIRLLDFTVATNNIGGRLFNTYAINENGLTYTLNESGDIYGDKTLAALGTEELQLQIHPVENDIDISDIKDAEQREFTASRSAQEIIAANDATYSEDIPNEYRKIVKFYFNEITKGE